MSHDKTVEQVIALAGLVQSTYLVDQIARTGQYDSASFNPVINSLFVFNPASASEVYGGLPGIQLGLRIVNDLLLGQHTSEYRATIRYAIGLMNLQKTAAGQPEMMSIIRSRLEHAALKAEHFSDNVHQITNSCAAVYQDTLSTLKYRIQVQGSMQQLQNPNNANSIRALLLAGIRAAMLWRQVGGSRWHLFFHRARLQRACKSLLEA